MVEERAAHRATQATMVGLAAILLWASLALLTLQARGIPSFELMALIFGVAFVVGMGVLGLRGRAGLRQLRQPVAAWVTSFLGLFVYHALYFTAFAVAPSARTSLFAYAWPVLIVLFSVVATGERLLLRHVAGAALGLAGTAVILLGRGEDAPGGMALVGYAAAFASAVVWAVYSVVNHRFAAVPSAMLVGVCGAVSLCAAGVHVAMEATVVPDMRQGVAILALGVGPTGLAFFAWDHATKHGDLPLLGALSYVTPLASTLLLVAAGAAGAGWMMGVSAVLIVGGAVVARGRSPSGVRGRI